MREETPNYLDRTERNQTSKVVKNRRKGTKKSITSVKRKMITHLMVDEQTQRKREREKEKEKKRKRKRKRKRERERERDKPPKRGGSTLPTTPFSRTLSKIAHTKTWREQHS
jgi:hypothetical protein